MGCEDRCIWSNTRPSPQTCPWCLSPSVLGLYTWHMRQRELAKADKQSILGWQIRKHSHDWFLFVCLAIWNICGFSVCAFVSVELAPSGRPGYVPVEKHSWSQTGSHSSVPVPRLTGWANREPTGSARHMIACLCWKCHLMPPCCPSQTVLGYVIGICQHQSHNKGEDDYRDTGKEGFFF